MNIAQWYRKNSERVDALSLRERIVVFIAALALLYLIWDSFIYSGVSNAHRRVQEQMAAVEKNRSALNQEMALMLQVLGQDPDMARKNEKSKLIDERRQLDVELQLLSVGLVSVNDLSKLLQDVLRRTGKLRLEKMTTLPVEVLHLSQIETSPNADGRPVPAAEIKDTGVFKHGVALQLKGGYQEIYEYLQLLEALNWRFYWESLQYSVDDYPKADIELRVYTLSTNEGAFGV